MIILQMFTLYLSTTLKEFYTLTLSCYKAFFFLKKNGFN